MSKHSKRHTKKKFKKKKKNNNSLTVSLFKYNKNK